MPRGGSNAEAVKVVIINTHYVETDARSFKSVVQRLTGKDSTVAAAGVPPGFDTKKQGHHYGGGMAAETHHPTALTRGLSFKDFDKLFMELPPVDELYRAIY